MVRARRRCRVRGGAVLAGLLAGALALSGCAASAPSGPAHPALGRPAGTTSLSAGHAPASTAVPAAVPAGFSPLSVTFVSADIGWVLGTVTTGAGRSRLAVAHTVDGGVTWSASPAPHVSFSRGGVAASASIRFADAADGWIVAPPSGSTDGSLSTLWSSHDGGSTWRQVPVPGGGRVAALQASDGITRMAVLVDHSTGTHFDLYATPSARDSWVRSATRLPIGAGPIPTVQMVLHRGAGWLVEDDRVVVAGARLAYGRWVPWTPPCTGSGGPAAVADSSTAELVAVCQEGMWGPPPPGISTGAQLFTSRDGGAHFAMAGAVGPPNAVVGPLASPPGKPQVVVVGAGPGLMASFDGGRTWRTVYRSPDGQMVVRFVGFTTAGQGVAIATGAEGSTLLMTRDGGASWGVETLSGPARA